MNLSCARQPEAKTFSFFFHRTGARRRRLDLDGDGYLTEGDLVACLPEIGVDADRQGDALTLRLLFIGCTSRLYIGWVTKQGNELTQHSFLKNARASQMLSRKTPQNLAGNSRQYLANLYAVTSQPLRYVMPFFLHCCTRRTDDLCDLCPLHDLGVQTDF